MNDPARPPRHTNRLAQESSPYLLQHAHNPVDWYPWGPEAFDAARKQNKPIFLSVGYSTCYWCHVMERQSFEVESIAAEMNQRFINIKVDREERPDVDQLYMTAVQILTRHGGWPMSVFLTPDLRPFYGGTYFPPTDMQGRPGFVSILRGIEDAYRHRPADVEKTASQLVNILEQHASPAPPESPIAIDDGFIESLIRRSISDYDPAHGGFGGAPKFPRETLLELLLVYLLPSDEVAAPCDPANPANVSAPGRADPPPPRAASSAAAAAAPAGAAPALKSQISKMVRHTLDALADGGIRDQLGGGFHRYSTDAEWLVPHFEIMLYDNAMLAWCYVEAYRQTCEPRYAAVARGVFDFVLREMTSPLGAFYTAMDAEVDGQEGLNYLWTADEIEELLGAEDAKLFNAVYGVDRGPNFADPHHGSGVPDSNILFLPVPLAQAARRALAEAPAELNAAPGGSNPTPEDLLESRLEPMRRKLYAARQKRKQPLLDTKIITSWNALMIRALAYGGKVLGDSRYTLAAARAAEFLLAAHRMPDGGLFRASRDGAAKYHGFLDDYAFLVQALLGVAEATERPDWESRAMEIATVMRSRFYDSGGGAFFFTEAQATDLILRQKAATDSPLPSGNAVAAMALLRLNILPEARQTLSVFAQQMQSHGEGMSAMVQAALMLLGKAGAFTVAAGVSSGADRPLSPAETARGIVSTRAQWTSPTELLLHVSILRGFHVNAHEVDPGSGLIATAVKVSPDAAAQVAYPAGQSLKLAFADLPLRVYSGDLQIAIRFPAAPAPCLRLSLIYQACDDAACLPPVTKMIDVPDAG